MPWIDDGYGDPEHWEDQDSRDEDYSDGLQQAMLEVGEITPCDLYGHSWNSRPDDDGQYRCIRCGEEQY